MTHGNELTIGLVRRRQTVERKARFIGQVMRGRLDVREIEDIGDTALSYGVIWTTYVLPRAESIGGLARLNAHGRCSGSSLRG
jgi:hypothetical protein